MAERLNAQDMRNATAFVLGRIGSAAEYPEGVADKTVAYLVSEFMMDPRDAAMLVADAPDNRFSASKTIEE